ncbi:hypothetical protein [Nonomuraea roseoviolacea]|uniref:Uncharacterized protein n=1 Tax=Nonomuraea roseoviolacea subsp. carminata TaxID=160689 RepID=A0ABT1K5S4_9ACTN|nr:hypothetical protein [Nonomuraea roseoviolacea]MCP2349340.1 hypothetical protein [Nonomuraea roseoviolacea subsp. carminata]
MTAHETALETTDQTDVIELLLAQHSMIRDLFDEVEKAPADRRAEARARVVIRRAMGKKPRRP